MSCYYALYVMFYTQIYVCPSINTRKYVVWVGFLELSLEFSLVVPPYELNQTSNSIPSPKALYFEVYPITQKENTKTVEG